MPPLPSPPSSSSSPFHCRRSYINKKKKENVRSLVRRGVCVCECVCEFVCAPHLMIHVWHSIGNCWREISSANCQTKNERRSVERRKQREKKRKAKTILLPAAVRHCYLYFYCAMFLANRRIRTEEEEMPNAARNVYCCRYGTQTMACLASDYLFRPNFCFSSSFTMLCQHFRFLLYSIFGVFELAAKIDTYLLYMCLSISVVVFFPRTRFLRLSAFSGFRFFSGILSLCRLRLCGDSVYLDACECVCVCSVFQWWLVAHTYLFMCVCVCAVVCNGGLSMATVWWQRRRQMLQFHIINTNLFWNVCSHAPTPKPCVTEGERLSKWDANLFIRSLIFNCRLKASVSRVSLLPLCFGIYIHSFVYTWRWRLCIYDCGLQLTDVYIHVERLPLFHLDAAMWPCVCVRVFVSSDHRECWPRRPV